MNSLCRLIFGRALRSSGSVNFGQIRCQFRVAVAARMEEEKATNYVRVRPVENEMDISFAFPPRCEDHSADARFRFRNFKRPSSEPLSISLMKIANSLNKNCGGGGNNKKEKRKSPHQATVGFGGAVPSQREESCDRENANGAPVSTCDSIFAAPAANDSAAPILPHVALWDGDALLTSDVALNSDGFKTGGRLQIDDQFYQVLFDPPAIKSLKLHKNRIVAGCPYAPQVELIQKSLCAVSTCRVEWFRSTNVLSDASSSSSSSSSAKDSAKKVKLEKLVRGWEKVGKEYCYSPSDDDVNRLLKCRCYPVRDDVDHFVELISPIPVSRLPLADGEVFPFEKRQSATTEFCDPDSADGQFRVVSYNLLADYYADSDFSRISLFPYCPAEWLHGEYRRQLLLREIPGYRPDVVMMQEVDRKMFRNGLTSVLGSRGMIGSLALKKEVPEGLATFWRTSRFHLLKSSENEFNDSLTHDPNLADILKVVDACAPLKEKMNILKTVYLINVLEDVARPDRVVVVANTHLYFHPPAAHIRLIQMEILLRQLRSVVKTWEDEGKTVSVILGGDFNSEPKRGLYEYLTKKSVKKTFNDWYSCGMAEYPGMDLSHEFSLFSAAGTPDYTNFVAGFCGTLDYIYADATKLELKREIPLSDHADVVKEIALPNRIFPSDHMPLVVELKWK